MQSIASERPSKALVAKLAAARARLARYSPSRPYLVVCSADNTFELRSVVGETIHRGKCSTGSYIMLRSPDGTRRWVFRTPVGRYTVRGKLVNPVWRKPDWAFVEEGRVIPPQGASERYERGVLGKYALVLGDGYMVHGTLYQRFLGLPVTHGCVRMGDADLEIVYREIPVGGYVFMY